MRPACGQRGVRRRRARLPRRAVSRQRRLTCVAVIADTHLPRGRRRLPDACLRQLERADLIVHAGDFVEASVLDELSTVGPVAAVFGNMDDPELKAALPRERVVEIGGARIGVIHIPGAAAGREARLAARFPECDAVIYGHTHVPQATRQGRVWILNPGSPTERRRAPSRSMLLLKVAAGVLTPRLLDLP